MQPGAYENYIQLMEVLCGQTRSNVDEPVYPDYYGGTYVNDDGDLVVLITEDDYTTRASHEIQTIITEENVLFVTCKNSYNRLQQVVDSISTLMKGGAEFASNIGMYGIDVINNYVLVYLLDDSEDKKKEFIEKFDNDLIQIGWCSPIEEHQSVDCGETIFDNGIGSIGYRAVDSEGNKGIVTAGHCFSVGDAVYYSPNYMVHNAELWGMCKYSAHDDGYIDAAFCVVNDPVYQPSNKLFSIDWGHTTTGGQSQSIDTLSTKLAQPTIGLVINSIGATSGRRSGTVKYSTFNVPRDNTAYALSDVIIANYVSNDGDSGGIVYAYQSLTNTRFTVGINKGRVYLRKNDGEIDTCAVCILYNLIRKIFGCRNNDNGEAFSSHMESSVLDFCFVEVVA